MKTLIILMLFGCLFTISSASAQQEKDKMLPVVTITATGTSVSEKVRKAFATSFKNADKAKWFQLNRNYLVKFIQNDQDHSALFNNNGKLIYHIAYGYEQNLPSALIHQVKSAYYDYKIGRVFSVSQNSRKIWVVNLESKNFLVLTRIEDSNMVEVSRLKNVGSPLLAARSQQ